MKFPFSLQRKQFLKRVNAPFLSTNFLEAMWKISNQELGFSIFTFPPFNTPFHHNLLRQIKEKHISHVHRAGKGVAKNFHPNVFNIAPPDSKLQNIDLALRLCRFRTVQIFLHTKYFVSAYFRYITQFRLLLHA